MFNTLHIKNFKSFFNTNDIKLAPITILAGQNSSGKSSIIQSILLLKQTVESPVSEESLILNGHYVSLGDFDDVFNDNADPKNHLSFGFTFSPNIPTPYDETDNLKKASFTLDFESSEEMFEEEKLKIPQLVKSTITGEIEGKNFIFSAINDQEYNNSLKKDYILINTENLNLVYRIIKSEGLDKSNILGVQFNTFLPESILIPYNKELHDFQLNTIKTIVSIIVTNFNLPETNINRHPRFVLRVLNRFKDKINGYPKIASEDELLSIIDKVERVFTDDTAGIWEIYNRTTLPYFLERLEQESFQEIEKTLCNALDNLEQLKATKKTIRKVPVGFLRARDTTGMGGIDDICSSISKILKNTYYLGPLREEPRAFYARFGSNDPMYVGQKGENVAFVLKHYSNKKIKTILPPTEGLFDPNKVTAEHCTLGEAVQQWLSYLGVAEEINVNKMGKFGLTIQAKIHGEKGYDLTNVGVGVSQVLPIIVLGLSTPTENSVLLIEQPELHLHPYVQSRLGDFLLSLSLAGKQIIAETHSEHVINRMRLHVAKGNLTHEDDLLVYFCQRTPESNETTLEKVKIDEFGSIEEYPEGFFDETEKQLHEILMAAFQKGSN